MCVCAHVSRVFHGLTQTMCENCGSDQLVYEWGFEARSTPSSVTTFDITSNAATLTTAASIQLRTLAFQGIQEQETYAISVRGECCVRDVRHIRGPCEASVV